MFKNLTLNDDKVKRKRRNDLSILNQANQFDYGKIEWQQSWTTTNKQYQNINNEWNNHTDLSHIPYLFHNKSLINLNGFPAKEPFRSIFQKDYRDYNPIEIKNFRGVNGVKRELANASQIILGNDKLKKSSEYLAEICDPKYQISRFDYNKINFKYDNELLNPITNEIIYKPTHKNWGFEYFNKDKDKKQISNDKPQALNTDFSKVYNPITNRYFN